MNSNGESVQTYSKIDFSNEEHVKLFQRHFGGAEHIKTNYPLLHRRFENAKAGRGKELSAKTAGDTGFIDRVFFHEVAYDKQKKCFYCKGITALTKKSDIHMVMEIFMNGELIGRNFSSKLNIQSGELDCYSRTVQERSAKDSVYAVMTSYWNTQQNSLDGATAQYEANYAGDEFVTGVTCTDPRKKTGKYPDRIRVSYGRYPAEAESIDYTYSESRDAGGNEKVYLEVNGSTSLKSGYAFDAYKDSMLTLYSTERGVIMYKGSAPKCTKTSGGFNWAFDKDWKDIIASSVRYGTEKYDMDMRLNFTCKDNSGNSYLQNIDVTTYAMSVTAPNVAVIPKLELLWGCLSKDTVVELESGVKRPISEINIGDKVAGPSGSARVINVYRGNEEEIYVVRTTDGLEIRATAHHPLMTSEGFVRSCDLTSLTKLKTKDGKFHVVTDCYPAPYEDAVYSLELENADSFYASGFISGTFSVENSRLAEAFKKEAPGDLDHEYAAEFEKIRSDMQKRLEV